MELTKIFKSLSGKWTLNRTIYHIGINQIDKASGIASFTKSNSDEPNSLFYDEIGKLSLHTGSKKINFNRKYKYQLNKDSIEIYLNDGVTKGNLFQTLTPTKNKIDLLGTEHVCNLDKHNGKHIFKDEFSFYTEYTVKGPKTDLQIKTYYDKLIADNNI